MRNSLKIFIIAVCILACRAAAKGQGATTFDLAQLFKTKKLTVYNRDVELVTDASKNGLVLSEDEGEGLVWIDGVSLSTGTIEIDLKGQDVFQHSFVGIAFHGLNDSTFEAIYFRPFQFRSLDPLGKSHGVQYINLPLYTWQKLREEKTGIYEKPVNPGPDPDNWFHATIVVKEKEVLVYVDHAAIPSLRVPLLSEIKTGRIALYTADRSGGSYANLVIKTD